MFFTNFAANGFTNKRNNQQKGFDKRCLDAIFFIPFYDLQWRHNNPRWIYRNCTFCDVFLKVYRKLFVSFQLIKHFYEINTFLFSTLIYNVFYYVCYRTLSKSENLRLIKTSSTHNTTCYSRIKLFV